MDVGCEALWEIVVMVCYRKNGLLIVWKSKIAIRENEDWRRELHVLEGMVNNVE